MLSKSCVYWIHLPEHTDMFTQGYIGVAKGGILKRYREHKSAAKHGSSLPIHNAIRKYKDELVADVVVLAPSEYCYEVEAKLRPEPNTGYNVSAGGTQTNLGSKRTKESRAKMSKAQKERDKFSEETLKRMSEAQLGKKMSSESIKKMSEAAKERGVLESTWKAGVLANQNLKAWEKPQALKKLWKQADSIFTLVKKNPTIGTRKLAKLCDFTYSQLLVIYKKIKAGWNPNLDTEWLIFSGKLSPDASGDKSLQTGISPN